MDLYVDKENICQRIFNSFQKNRFYSLNIVENPAPISQVQLKILDLEYQINSMDYHKSNICVKVSNRLMLITI